ncbi:hypothetical protein C2S52_005624 [Perilla frutescens var. hirtella]|nr:hypothetical protein C2S52_005624 [Perilla frutescens var. hirtella]
MADAAVELLLSTLKDLIQSEIQLVRGFDKELEDLSEKLNTIRNVLDDAERRRFTEKTVKDWLWRLEQTSHQMEDVLEEWNYAILEHKIESESPNNQTVCSFIPSSCFCFKKLAVRHDIASKVRDLKSKLDKILNEKGTYNFVISQPKSDHSPAPSWRVQSTSLIDLEQVQGRDDIRDDLVIKLSGSHEGSGYRILSIVGGGGLGKTTLAQIVYNHPSVKACFGFTIWICVSDPFNVADIAKGIIKGIDKNSSPDATQLDTLLNDLKDRISGKKILLVLDDVWNKKGDNLRLKWEPLENVLKCAASTKILVTTRDEMVAKLMGSTDEDIIRPELLSDEDCWLLLSRSAALSENGETKRFEEIGRGIAKKCKGLPLAAKTLGSLLLRKKTPEEWEEILKSEMWGLEHVEVELFPHLLLSYHELSPALKRCFSYCAYFPKDTYLKVDNLIRMWMALGYLGSNTGSVKEDMELKGREYFQDLAMRSLLQDFEKGGDDGQIMSCKMHDIIHDFAQFVRKSPVMSMSTCQVCNTNLISRVKEYRGLSWDEGTPLNICDCLTSLRVLKVGRKLNGSSQGMKRLIHLRWLDMSFGRVSEEDLKIICKLYFLQTLLLKGCGLDAIPGEIGNLIHLRHLNLGCHDLYGLPEGIAQLTGLHRLSEFKGGSGRNKLGLLKNLNRLESLTLEISNCSTISDLEELVEDAQQAELKNKICLQSLTLEFPDNNIWRDEKEERSSSSSLWVDVIEALEPNHNLERLEISFYEGSKLPLWISLPHNLLREIRLEKCSELSSLPPLGKLPFLEMLRLGRLYELKLVGREWLGIRGREGEVMKNDHIPSSSSSSATNVVVAFPKLIYLEFKWCEKWEEWEDITAGEEESAVVSIMPCLRVLQIRYCEELKLLPHRLLRKAQSLDIEGSTKLIECYGGELVKLPLGDEYP